jgi:aminocarboxymuconate-semialdehyde decarboxylase
MGEHSSVDIHAHYFPDAFLKLVASEGGNFGATFDESGGAGPVIDVGLLHVGPVGRRFIDLDARNEDMDGQGVQVQALSLTQPMAYWSGNGEFARRLTEAYNDALAEAHQAHPDRLVGFATLPMQDVPLAVAEAKRLAGLPGIKGVYMATNIAGTELSTPDFFPVYEVLEDAGLPLFLHPLEVIGMQRLRPYYLLNLLGNPFDTCVAAAHLIFGGVLDRFPKLEICLSHAGGAFPFLVGRLHHGWKVREECKHLEHGPETYMRRFHYDTISHSAPSLEYLIGQVGADRVMLGSDYCFDMGYERPVEVVTSHEGLSEDDKALILGGNAGRLLGL